MNSVRAPSREQRIAYPDDPIMAGMWLACVRWAYGEPSIREQFEADTGLTYTAPANGLEAMIDRATGHANTVADAFVDWVNENLWGENPFEVQPSGDGRRDSTIKHPALPGKVEG